MPRGNNMNNSKHLEQFENLFNIKVKETEKICKLSNKNKIRLESIMLDTYMKKYKLGLNFLFLKTYYRKTQCLISNSSNSALMSMVRR